jgi:hypothetical protein
VPQTAGLFEGKFHPIEKSRSKRAKTRPDNSNSKSMIDPIKTRKECPELGVVAARAHRPHLATLGRETD